MLEAVLKESESGPGIRKSERHRHREKITKEQVTTGNSSRCLLNLYGQLLFNLQIRSLLFQ